MGTSLRNGTKALGQQGQARGPCSFRPRRSPSPGQERCRIDNDPATPLGAGTERTPSARQAPPVEVPNVRPSGASELGQGGRAPHTARGAGGRLRKSPREPHRAEPPGRPLTHSCWAARWLKT
jgi:hypothetical protein